MSSVVNISLEVIQRFNPTDSEIEQLIKELNKMIEPVSVMKPKSMSAEEIQIQKFEEWFKAKLFPPNNLRF